MGLYQGGARSNTREASPPPPSSATAADAQAGAPGAPTNHGRPTDGEAGSCALHIRVRGLVDRHLHRKCPISGFLVASQQRNWHPEDTRPVGSRRTSSHYAATDRARAHRQAQPPGAAALPTATSGCPASRLTTSHSGSARAAPFLASPPKHWDDLPSAGALNVAVPLQVSSPHTGRLTVALPRRALEEPGRARQRPPPSPGAAGGGLHLKPSVSRSVPGSESQDTPMPYGHFKLYFGTHCPILN